MLRSKLLKLLGPYIKYFPTKFSSIDFGSIPERSKSYKRFKINLKIPEDLLHYNSTKVSSLEIQQPCDKNGIEVFSYKGSNYYHPVRMAQRSLQFLNSYRLTKNETFLTTSIKYAEKLFETGTIYMNCLIFPYHFDFPLHGFKNQTMRAPWYSAMAQGLALSLFSRLYSFTPDTKYKNWADLISNSLNLEKGFSEIWFSCKDSKGYLWFEEYPMEECNFTLNGFIFTIFGLYDYYRMFLNNENVFNLLQESLNTVYYEFPLFRVKNGTSFYCLKHKIQYKAYHKVHIGQFKDLYNITSENTFLEYSDLMISDKRNIYSRFTRH